MDAGDQQPLAVAVGQEVDGVGDARRTSRQHDNAVRGVFRRRLIGLQLREKPDEPADDDHGDDAQRAQQQPRASQERRGM
jgi:hypothetical protein